MASTSPSFAFVVGGVWFPAARCLLKNASRVMLLSCGAQALFAVAAHGEPRPSGARCRRPLGGRVGAEAVEQDVDQAGGSVPTDAVRAFDEPGVGHEEQHDVFGGE